MRAFTVGADLRRERAVLRLGLRERVLQVPLRLALAALGALERVAALLQLRALELQRARLRLQP